MSSGPYYLESVERVMRVLDTFTPDAPELRVVDISERSGIHKTQVRRIVSTLESGYYLARDPETKRYRLGIRLFHLGLIARNYMNLRRLARPYLQQLVKETQETARLFVPDEGGPICIDLVESPRSIRVFARLGAKMPWHAGTSPKLILAYLPREQRERILGRGPFTRYTELTITDPDKLRQAIQTIRGHDVYVAAGDLDRDAVGVSAPIFDHAGCIAGAVSVSAPISRMSDQELDRIIGLVREAGTQISEQLGYHRDLEHLTEPWNQS